MIHMGPPEPGNRIRHNTHNTQKGKFMTKSPYEIRLDVLRMAQEQANQKHFYEWEKAAKTAELSESKLLTEVPEFPTADQILAEANKLKGFIDNG